jgi:hypothetical protein
MGSITRTGAWTVPGLIVVRQRFGSTSLDFRDATFTDRVTTLELDVRMGSVQVHGPDSLTVDTDAVRVVLGSLNQHDSAAVPAPGGPVLTIIGRIVLGSLIIRRPR